MNSDRQKTISHALVMESWRTRIPPVDQQKAATTMNRIARRWRAAASFDGVGNDGCIGIGRARNPSSQKKNAGVAQAANTGIGGPN